MTAVSDDYQKKKKTETPSRDVGEIRGGINEVIREQKSAPKEREKLEKLQDSLDTLEKQYSEKRKEQTERHFWLMIGITLASFVLVFLTTFYFSSSNQFSLPTVNQNIFASQSTQGVIIDGFQLALVLSIAVAIIPLIVFSAGRSRAIRHQNDELAALSLDIQRLRNSILTLRQEEVFEEGIAQKEEYKVGEENVPEAGYSSTEYKVGEENVPEAGYSSTEYKVGEENVPEAGYSSTKLLELLKGGKISQFNDLRQQLGNQILVLENANLSEANLSEANLSAANLSNANLSNADLFHADLSNANLLNANLSNANLSNADLFHADLSNANLSNANLSNADLTYAYLSDAILEGADFEDVVIEDATIDEDLLMQLREKKAKNVPSAARQKELSAARRKKLREKLNKG
jgi:Pentapeptide repeats (8 copies)